MTSQIHTEYNSEMLSEYALHLEIGARFLVEKVVHRTARKISTRHSKITLKTLKKKKKHLQIITPLKISNVILSIVLTIGFYISMNIPGLS